MTNRGIVAVLAWPWVSIVTAHAGVIIEVPGDFPTIQEAIVAAADGDEIRVAAGTYAERIDFLGKAVTLLGVDGAGATVIDGGAGGTTVTCATGEGPQTVMTGFTITGASDSGMLNDGASPVVRECEFVGNESPTAGGGMRNVNGAAPTVVNSAFDTNAAAFGAGMANDASSPVIDGCRFLGNVADDAGGGLGNRAESAPVVRNSRFLANRAGSRGAAIDQSGGGLEIFNCTFVYGRAPSGAALANAGATTHVTSSDFLRNTASVEGGAILNEGGTVEIAGTTFCSNVPDDVSGGFVDAGDVHFAAECPDPCRADLDDDGQVGFDDLVQVLSAWGPCEACVEDLNEDGAVGFADLLLLLATWGPCPGACYDEATECEDCLVVAAADCERLSRIYLGDGTECACGACCVAGECAELLEPSCELAGGAWQGVGVACEDILCPCLGDTDGDRIVGFDDLLRVLTDWGPCKGECRGDVDGDGSVGFDDLLIVLARFGPCD